MPQNTGKCLIMIQSISTCMSPFLNGTVVTIKKHLQSFHNNLTEEVNMLPRQIKETLLTINKRKKKKKQTTAQNMVKEHLKQINPTTQFPKINQYLIRLTITVIIFCFSYSLQNHSKCASWTLTLQSKQFTISLCLLQPAK